MDSLDVAMHYGGFNSIRGCYESQRSTNLLPNAKVRTTICFSHYIYICIFPHLFLAKWRLSMKPREDLGEGELDFAVLGPHGF